MASFISSPTSLCSVSTTTKSLLLQHSSFISYNVTLKFSLSPLIPHLGMPQFSTWTGLKHLGLSITPICLNKGLERKGKILKDRMVFASLFGVGAPEALVIGVVALLVFGPKGLAEVARNLGKTLRAFQPTIRELQDVSREFKSTLEREISLDDIPNQRQNTYSSSRANPGSPISSVVSQSEADPNGAPSQSTAYTTEDYLKITPPAPGENQVESQSAAKETAATMPPPQNLEHEV